MEREYVEENRSFFWYFVSILSVGDFWIYLW